MSLTSHDSCACWPPMKRSRNSCCAFRSFCTCCNQAKQAQLTHASIHQQVLLRCPLSIPHRLLGAIRMLFRHCHAAQTLPFKSQRHC